MTDGRTDSELIEKFLDGNESAFNLLAARYRDRIYWHCRRMLGSHFDADEVTQQVLIVIYKKLHTFKGGSQLYTWIYRITSTRCLNYIRKQKVRQAFSLQDKQDLKGDSAEDIVQGIENRQKIEKLEKMMQELPPKQREVFIMRHYDELTYKEISEITGTTEGALKSTYSIAYKKILQLMGHKK